MPITFSLANEVFLRSPIGQLLAIDQLRCAALQTAGKTAGIRIGDAVKGGLSKLASPPATTPNMLFVLFSIQGCHPDSRTYQKILVMVSGSYYLLTMHRPEVMPAVKPSYVGQSIEDYWELETLKTLTASAANALMNVAITKNDAKEAEKSASGSALNLAVQGFAPGHVPITTRRAPPAPIMWVSTQQTSPAPTQVNRSAMNQIEQAEFYSQEEVYQ
jgi:hypothetical protein